MLAITLVHHIKELLMSVSFEKWIGLGYMVGIIGFLLYLSFKHKSEFWEAIRGSDGKLEVPELIIAICMIIYPNVILADIFLGLHASDGIFWSLDGIIFFALTGRVFLNRFGKGGNAQQTTEELTESVGKVVNKIEDVINKKPVVNTVDPKKLTKITEIVKHLGFSVEDVKKMSDTEIDQLMLQVEAKKNAGGDHDSEEETS
jgi:hypothetical protein